jgi:hypothetical protein
MGRCKECFDYVRIIFPIFSFLTFAGLHSVTTVRLPKDILEIVFNAYTVRKMG